MRIKKKFVKNSDEMNQVFKLGEEILIKVKILSMGYDAVYVETERGNKLFLKYENEFLGIKKEGKDG